MSKATVPFFILLLFLSACASSRVNPLMSQAFDVQLEEKEFKALSKTANELWAGRDKKENIEDFIVIDEKICRSTHSSQSDLVLLARAYYLLSEYFTVDAGTRSHLWDQAANWSEKALDFNSAFKEKTLKQKIPTELALDLLSKKDSEALYWYAAALGRWASEQGISSSLKYKDRVKKMIDRVAILNPNYFYGAVYRYYGVYYALLPEFNEEDLKNSRKNFEKALKRSPDYFSNHFFFAQYYAKKVDDQNLYKKHLQFVVHGNPHHLENVYPEQALEQHRVQAILEGTHL